VERINIMKSPKVSVVILNWNGYEDTIECLESLKKIDYPNYEIIIVDNASIGDDVKILQTRFGDYIHMIANDRNDGFAGGCNIGIHYILEKGTDYILLLNNDIIVDPEFLTEMVRVAETDISTGIIGPKTYLYSDPEQFQLVWCEVNMYRGRPSFIGSGELDRGQYDNLRDVDYIQGSCFLIKRAVIDSIGLLDKTFFFSWEETDYCFRARKAGYKILYVPPAKIWHKNLISRIKPWYKTLRKLDQMNIRPSTFYYSILGNFRFMKKNASRKQYFCFLVYLLGYYFWWQCAVILLYYRDPSLFKAYIRGVRDGLLLKV
jgi:hypothetical protein